MSAEPTATSSDANAAGAAQQGSGKAPRSADTTILLALAAWLIFNSHLEAFYAPRPWLAADGLLGNLLFFVMSGYGIQRSLARGPVGFGTYFARRLLRLYPVVLFCVVVFDIVLQNGWKTYGPMEYVSRLLWPTTFTYVQNIVPFYVLLWLIGNGAKPVWRIITAIVIGVAAYAVFVAMDAVTIEPGTRLALGTRPHNVSWAIYWVATASGALAGALTWTPKLSIIRLLILFALCMSYFAAKAMMVVKGAGAQFYFVLHLQALAACLFALTILTVPAWVARIKSVPLLGWFLRRSALLTLEIYVVHSCLVGMGWFTPIPFPANILVLAVVTWMMSEALSAATKALRSRLGAERE